MGPEAGRPFDDGPTEEKGRSHCRRTAKAFSNDESTLGGQEKSSWSRLTNKTQQLKAKLVGTALWTVLRALAHSRTGHPQGAKLRQGTQAGGCNSLSFSLLPRL
jgi:hypothetical protein